LASAKFVFERSVLERSASARLRLASETLTRSSLLAVKGGLT
jgi:hypothetical protein